MSGQLGDLVVSVRADLARFQSDMGKMQKTAQDSADRMSRSLGGLDGAIKKVGAAFAALGVGLSAAALTSWVKGAIDAADELAKMSQRVGVSVGDLAKLNYAGSLADVSMEQLAKGLKQLSKNMVEAASGSKEQVAAFKALGVEFRNADGGMRKSSEVFTDIAQKVSLLDDGATKTAISMKLFGKSGADLIPLLNSGATGLQEMAKEAERLGLVIDEKTAKAAENFNDNLTRLQSSGRGLAFSISEIMLPPLVQLTDELNRVAQADSKWQKIIGYMQTIVKLQTNPLSYVWDPLAGAKKKPGSVNDIAGGIAGAAAGAAGQIKSGKTAAEITLERYLKSLEAPVKPRVAKTGKSVKGKTEDIPSAYAMLVKDAKAFAKAWEEDQKKLREDAEWISDQRKAYSEAMAKALKDEHELSTASLEHKLTLVDTAEIFRDISRAEAAEQRLSLTQKLVKEQAKWVDITGQGVEKLDELNAKVREAQAEVLKASNNMAAGGMAGAMEYIDKLPSKFEAVRDITKDAFKNMEDALVDFVKTGKLNFSSLVDSIIADLARMTIRQTITAPLASALMGAFTKVNVIGGPDVSKIDMSWVTSAKGNAFSGGNVVPFAKGGIVSRPTLFPFARGVGLMGEAGAEGILPLARTSGGELGVKATGGSSLTINVPVSVSGNNALAADLRNEIERTVIDVVRRHS